MVNLNLPDNSKIMPGKTHGVDGPNKIVFNIYRWNREDNKNPRVDKYFVDKKKTWAYDSRCLNVYKK